MKETIIEIFRNGLLAMIYHCRKSRRCLEENKLPMEDCIKCQQIQQRLWKELDKDAKEKQSNCKS